MQIFAFLSLLDNDTAQVVENLAHGAQGPTCLINSNYCY